MQGKREVGRISWDLNLEHYQRTFYVFFSFCFMNKHGGCMIRKSVNWYCTKAYRMCTINYFSFQALEHIPLPCHHSKDRWPLWVIIDCPQSSFEFPQARLMEDLKLSESRHCISLPVLIFAQNVKPGLHPVARCTLSQPSTGPHYWTCEVLGCSDARWLVSNYCLQNNHDLTTAFHWSISSNASRPLTGSLQHNVLVLVHPSSPNGGGAGPTD